jgi:hypothetical protein
LLTLYIWMNKCSGTCYVPTSDQKKRILLHGPNQLLNLYIECTTHFHTPAELKGCRNEALRPKTFFGSIVLKHIRFSHIFPRLFISFLRCFNCPFNHTRMCVQTTYSNSEKKIGGVHPLDVSGCKTHVYDDALHFHERHNNACVPWRR